MPQQTDQDGNVVPGLGATDATTTIDLTPGPAARTNIAPAATARLGRR